MKVQTKPFDEGFRFYGPLKIARNGLLAQDGAPLLLLDPTTRRAETAQALAHLNYLVLAVDSSRADYLGRAVDLIAPLPAKVGRGRMKPVAVVLEAFHPMLPPPLEGQPPEPGPGPRNLSVAAALIVDWLNERGLSPQQIPYFLYTDHPEALEETRSLLEFAKNSGRKSLALFRQAVERSEAGPQADGLVEASLSVFARRPPSC